MKKQQAVIFTIVIVMVTIFSTTALAVNSDMGLTTEPLTDGSETYPYLIEDFDDFQVFADSANYETYWVTGIHTRLDCDIDLDPLLAGRQTYTTAVIATGADSTQYFKGIFNGSGHTVRNLTIDTAGANTLFLALFGRISDSDTEIKNLGVVNVSIIGGSTSSRIGGLCGYSYEGSIDNCYATGVINGGSIIGGLCGQNSSTGGDGSIPASISNSYAQVSITGTISLGGLCGSNGYSNITNCHATGDVSGSGLYGSNGGLCGSNDHSNITNSYATGNVYCTGMYGDNGGLCGTNYGGVVSFCFATGSVTGADASVGGLCGENKNGGAIRYCYATGHVTGYYSADYLGGLCGANSDASGIINCYATGDVSSSSSYGIVGGLCGYQRHDGTNISNCYATGFLTSSYRLGGVCGTRVGASTITNCYWDTQTSGTTISAGGTGKTTAQMHLQSTFTGWDFSSLWWINEGRNYPKLDWQPVADFDNDSRVSFAEFIVMSISWLASDGDVNYNSVCELSGDTIIDAADLTLFTDHWLEGVE